LRTIWRPGLPGTELAVGELAGETDDRGERGPQLVAHGGDELHPGALRLLELTVAAGELGGEAAEVGDVGEGEDGAGRRPLGPGERHPGDGDDEPPPVRGDDDPFRRSHLGTDPEGAGGGLLTRRHRRPVRIEHPSPENTHGSTDEALGPGEHVDGGAVGEADDAVGPDHDDPTRRRLDHRGDGLLVEATGGTRRPPERTPNVSTVKTTVATAATWRTTGPGTSAGGETAMKRTGTKRATRTRRKVRRRRRSRVRKATVASMSTGLP